MPTLGELSTLHFAAAADNAEVAKYLLSKGVSMGPDRNGVSPLHAAACNNATRVARVLLSNTGLRLDLSLSSDSPEMPRSVGELDGREGEESPVYIGGICVTGNGRGSGGCGSKRAERAMKQVLPRFVGDRHGSEVAGRGMKQRRQPQKAEGSSDSMDGDGIGVECPASERVAVPEGVVNMRGLLSLRDSQQRLAIHDVMVGSAKDDGFMELITRATTAVGLQDHFTARDCDGETPLAKAVKFNNYDKVRKWLSLPGVVNKGEWSDYKQCIERNQSRCTTLTLSPLCFAIDLNIMQLLLDAKADIRFGSHGHTPLDYARSRQGKYPMLWDLARRV